MGYSQKKLINSCTQTPAPTEALPLKFMFQNYHVYGSKKAPPSPPVSQAAGMPNI